MPTRQKRLVIAGGVFLFVVTLAWNLVSDARQGAAAIAPPASAPMPSATPATPVVVSTSPAASVDVATDRFEYSIGVAELDGLSPDASPGSSFDLWVTWEPPLVEQPDVQLLLRAVRLERIIPPVVPEGPTVAVLSIPRTKNAVRSLIFGDQYGRLSVVGASST